MTKKAFEHFHFKVRGFERSYAFGVNTDNRYDRAYDEGANITLQAVLLSKHRLKSALFELCIIGDPALNKSEESKYINSPNGIGGLHMRKNNAAAYIRIPDRAISTLWPVISEGGFPFICVSICRVPRGSNVATGISFLDQLDPEDI